jgi:transporter family-2 protein
MKKHEHQGLDTLAVISAVMIALQARANGELSHLLGNGLQAALISFGSGLIIIAVIAVFNRNIKDGMVSLYRAVCQKELPKWMLGAGMLGGTFVAIQTQTVPIIGVAIYSVASIAGQTTMSLFIDRIGLTGGGKKPISSRRITASVITVIAVMVSVWDRIDSASLSPLPVFLGFVAGALVGVQRALNGRINESSHQSFATSFLNFIMGTSILTIVLTVSLLSTSLQLASLPNGPWWIYTGGVIGVIYIAFTSKIVQHIGVLNFTLFSVGGQLVGALLIDLIFPSDGVHVSKFLVIGIALTYLGVIVGVGNAPLQKLLKRR